VNILSTFWRVKWPSLSYCVPLEVTVRFKVTAAHDPGNPHSVGGLQMQLRHQRKECSEVTGTHASCTTSALTRIHYIQHKARSVVRIYDSPPIRESKVPPIFISSIVLKFVLEDSLQHFDCTLLSITRDDGGLTNLKIPKNGTLYHYSK
jgi:hypothetical protein